MAPQTVSAEKRYRLSLLLDTYGELLTDKQRTFLKGYYEEDLSFGEIAREYGVTRQAIFDSVKHGEASLERYDQVLRLVGRAEEARKSVGALKRRSAMRLRSLSAQVRDENEEILREWIVKELDSVAGELERDSVLESKGLTASEKAGPALGEDIGAPTADSEVDPASPQAPPEPQSPPNQHSAR